MTEIVAVTGAEGFIGSHLVERLVRHGQRVRAMVLYNSFDSRGWLDTLPADVLAEVEVLPGDVRDAASAHDLVRGARVVYHLAALIAIPYSYRAPRSYVDTNVDRHAERPRRRPSTGHAAAGAHLDERDLRHGPDGRDRRDPPAAGPVAVRRVEGGGGQARGVLPPELRRPGRHALPVQHVRAAPVGPGRDPDRDHADRRRAHERSRWARSTRPATSCSSRTPPPPSTRSATPPRPPWWASGSTRAPATRCRSARSPPTSPA